MRIGFGKVKEIGMGAANNYVPSPNVEIKPELHTDLFMQCVEQCCSSPKMLQDQLARSSLASSHVTYTVDAQKNAEYNSPSITDIDLRSAGPRMAAKGTLIDLDIRDPNSNTGEVRHLEMIASRNDEKSGFKAFAFYERARNAITIVFPGMETPLGGDGRAIGDTLVGRQNPQLAFVNAFMDEVSAITQKIQQSEQITQPLTTSITSHSLGASLGIAALSWCMQKEKDVAPTILSGAQLTCIEGWMEAKAGREIPATLYGVDQTAAQERTTSIRAKDGTFVNVTPDSAPFGAQKVALAKADLNPRDLTARNGLHRVMNIAEEFGHADTGDPANDKGNRILPNYTGNFTPNNLIQNLYPVMIGLARTGHIPQAMRGAMQQAQKVVGHLPEEVQKLVAGLGQNMNRGGAQLNLSNDLTIVAAATTGQTTRSR